MLQYIHFPKEIDVFFWNATLLKCNDINSVAKNKEINLITT